MENRKRSRLRLWLEAVGIALIGGFLFELLHVPLPWMLGPLTAVMLWGLTTRRQLYQPMGFQKFALIVFGYLIGSSFTRATALQIVHQLPSIFVSTVLTISFSVLIGLWMAKGAQIGVETAVFGSVPGGLSQMAVLSEDYEEVDVTAVTLMQTIRLITVVMIVPFLTVKGLEGGHATAGAAASANASFFDISSFFGYPWESYVAYPVIAVVGAVIGKRIRMPIAFLLGPMVAVAITVVAGLPAPHLPPLLLMVPQILLGIYLGLLMRPQNLGSIKRLSLYTLLSNVLLILFSLALGWVLSHFYGMSFSSGFLSTAPGGMAEIGATAALVHADVSLVSGYQFFRVFFIMFAMPPVLGWWMRRRRRKEAGV